VQSILHGHILPGQSCPTRIHNGRIGDAAYYHSLSYFLQNSNGSRYQKYHGFEFMQDLVDEMTRVNPAKRPLIEDVLAKFSHIRKSLSGFKLRSPLISKEKPSLFTIFGRAKQALLTVQYIFLRKAAIPEP
jgi:hypothetical protein